MLLFCQASDSHVRIVTDILQAFCDASGLKVKLEKSRDMCSSKVSRLKRDAFTVISGIRCVGDLGTYLGFPLIKGRVRNSMLTKCLKISKLALLHGKENSLINLEEHVLPSQ